MLFYWWRKPEYPEKTINLTNYHIMLYGVYIATNEVQTHKKTLVVIGTECTGSCNSNYHLIMTTTAPIIV